MAAPFLGLKAFELEGLQLGPFLCQLGMSAIDTGDSILANWQREQPLLIATVQYTAGLLQSAVEGKWGKGTSLQNCHSHC